MSLYLNYSSTAQILDSMTKEEANKISYGWVAKTTDWLEKPIKHLLTTTPIAPGIFKSGHKVIKDFQGYQFVMLDFDSPENVPAKSMIDTLKVKYPDTAYAVFASVRHQQDYIKDGKKILGHDKYRIIFPLGTSPTKKEVEDLNTYFLQHYPKLDASSFMLARYFYKGTDKIWHFNEGTSYLNTNAIYAEVQALKRANKIKTYIKPDMVVLTEYGDELELQDVMSKISVHCPFHTDSSPSAFADLTPNGAVMLFCSSCQSRGEGTDGKGNYYMQNARVNAERVTVFWNEEMHTACHVKPDGEIKKLNIGKDWLNFCRRYGMDPESDLTLPRASFTYDPLLPHGLIEEQGKYNIYKASKYYKEYASKIPNTSADFKAKAPHTHAILYNLTGNDARLEYVLNWFGYLLQTGKQIGTAILFQGQTQGIGKDLLFKRVWTPLFGEKNVQDENGSAIGERFTSQYANARLVRFDECFAVQDYNENVRRLQWLKNRITAKHHQIEGKGQDKVVMPHYCAYILHSNVAGSLPLEQGDRRFVILENEKAVPVKKLSWYINEYDLEQKLEAELPIVAEYIQSIDINKELANTAIETSAKTRAQDASQNEFEAFAHALRDRDVNYFEIEDALTSSGYDPLLVPTTTALITEMIQLHNAIPAAYINALIRAKSQVKAPLAKRILIGFKVSAVDTKITKNGKQYRVYRYVENTD